MPNTVSRITSCSGADELMASQLPGGTTALNFEMPDISAGDHCRTALGTSVMRWDTALSSTVTAHLGSIPSTTAFSWAAPLLLGVTGRPGSLQH